MKKINLILVILSLLFCSCSKDEDINGNGSHKGHDYVDLGLSVKWATCNIGASDPTDFGDYYSWGETKVKDDYSDDGMQNIGSNISGTKYDVARAKWGGKWRMPTLAEWKELMMMCTWEYKQGGYLITGKNGNSIFLPTAGYWEDEFEGGEGYYWTSTLYEEGYPYSIIFDRWDYDTDDSIYAGHGHTVRAVY